MVASRFESIVTPLIKVVYFIPRTGVITQEYYRANSLALTELGTRCILSSFSSTRTDPILTKLAPLNG